MHATLQLCFNHNAENVRCGIYVPVAKQRRLAEYYYCFDFRFGALDYKGKDNKKEAGIVVCQSHLRDYTASKNYMQMCFF